MAELTCCFTGHRALPNDEITTIEARAEACIRDIYAKGVRCFRVGGAVGFDTLMAQLLFRLRESGMPDIKVILMYPFDGFMDGWEDVQIALYAELLPRYDEVHCVCDEGGSASYLARDRALVDGADFCIAYCKAVNSRSGTAYTMHYAEKAGLTIYNIATGIIKPDTQGVAKSKNISVDNC